MSQSRGQRTAKSRKTKKEKPDPRARTFAVVRRIPAGCVATYGQVARLAGIPGHARQVGYALHALGRVSSAPWHRVINHKGCISPRSSPGPEIIQRTRLEREGVVFDARGRVSLACYGWRPSTREASGPAGARSRC
ncbi:MAG: MGMT family protein [Deltaproteobacteria bacterium]|nr:MGMT family protein [Deltaproteobacteria bacterium]